MPATLHDLVYCSFDLCTLQGLSLRGPWLRPSGRDLETSDFFNRMMKALFFDQPSNRLEVRSIPIPTPKPDEALLKVSIAGICSTDLEITRGYVPGYSSILGHEFVGVVASCEGVPGLIGKRGRIYRLTAYACLQQPYFSQCVLRLTVTTPTSLALTASIRGIMQRGDLCWESSIATAVWRNMWPFP